MRHAYRYLLLLLALWMPQLCNVISADNLDVLEQRLRNNQQIQEKIYVHTDNNCYFIGDTLWYKAYVVRADDLHPTNMSKMLYVELVAPDGVVVDRQRVVVSDKNYTCGQFALKDSLYSGYYEIRAYTRWMLNFNVTSRPYTRDDRALFYNYQMARDYYRDWQDLYSRVIPVYSRPREAGDYDGKYMYARPKREVPFVKKNKLLCTFYPEGGTLVNGLKSRVAFEVTDQDGQALTLAGKLDGATAVKAGHMGRGTFAYTPSAKGDRGQLVFTWNGDKYTFKLPKAEDAGAVVTLQNPAFDGDKQSPTFALSSQGCTPAAYAVLCRGRLMLFERLQGATSITPDVSQLTTGVNELLVFDADGNVLASRPFFVNHHDMASPLRVTTDKTDYKPYEPIQLSIAAEDGTSGMPVSVSLRDTRTDDSSYNDGDMLTDLLLSSDLKGFIASPAYYFASDDATHRQDLDVLLMVQGWNKYTPLREVKDQVGLGQMAFDRLRYTPEKTLTIEGRVRKQLSEGFLEPDDVFSLASPKSVSEQMVDEALNAVGEGGVSMSGWSAGKDVSEGSIEATESAQPDGSSATKGSSDSKDPNAGGTATTDAGTSDGSYLGVNQKSIKHEVLVEAEVEKDGMSAGSVQMSHDGGQFLFEIPPFYGKAILFLTAYDRKDSLKRCIGSSEDKHRFDEEWYPDYYVTRDIFYPVFSHPYSYYQTHLPELLTPVVMGEDSIDYSKADGTRTLQNVSVKAKRRTRRALDYSKPAYVVDAYDVYNDATDRGLSWGIVNMGTFPPIAAQTIYGNMNRYRTYNVLGKLDKYTFYTNFSPMQAIVRNRSNTSLFKDLHLNRIDTICFYTDFEPRNYTDRHTEQLNLEDIVVVYKTIPDDGKRYTYRDRRYVLPGFTKPERQYCPDYSQRQPAAPTDYRRTLYWNPNAVLDANGEFHATAYNNSKETRVKASAAGQAADGKFFVQE